jgi:hypothetical protein
VNGSFTLHSVLLLCIVVFRMLYALKQLMLQRVHACKPRTVLPRSFGTQRTLQQVGGMGWQHASLAQLLQP